MKQILFFALALSISSTTLMAQTGTCSTSKQGILSGENGEIFQKEYDSYKANDKALSEANLKGVSLTVVLGNWCEDSQREVPRLMKLIDTPIFNVPVSYHLVDREKYCADPEVQKLEVKYVPAIIVYKDGKEVGRIIETPTKSLEEDIANMLAK